jgi:hypothetical protein
MIARPNSLALMLVLLATAGCARAIEVNSEPSTVYAIEVHNPQSVDMIVSLGTVRADERERFVIAAPPTPRITVTGRSSAGRVAGPIVVELRLGTTSAVTLQ